MGADVKKIVVAKALILGDQGVGKTSLVLRYLKQEVNGTVTPTIGASYFPCSISIGDTLVKLQVWDTAGQERFKSMAPLFYRNSSAALLVFDLTHYDSFLNVKEWMLELNRNIDDPVVTYVIGNKTDLVEERQVSREEAVKYSNEVGAKYYECSALYNQRVEEVFHNVALEMIKLYGELALTKTMNVCDGISVDNSIAANTIDYGTVIVPGSSKENIAHGVKVNNFCCFN
ncbi:ras-related protein RABF2b-like [Photinus pyralis]|uniref:Uncharacterized protein n=1 Tax=Photinus pyralis TaxID=7054 RepID=A0A1Y1N7S6_PHOPY|nr:ras-related protein RABF2b-like [Photinus pyralis]